MHFPKTLTPKQKQHHHSTLNPEYHLRPNSLNTKSKRSLFIRERNSPSKNKSVNVCEAKPKLINFSQVCISSSNIPEETFLNRPLTCRTYKRKTNSNLSTHGGLQQKITKLNRDSRGLWIQQKSIVEKLGRTIESPKKEPKQTKSHRSNFNRIHLSKLKISENAEVKAWDFGENSPWLPFKF